MTKSAPARLRPKTLSAALLITISAMTTAVLGGCGGSGSGSTGTQSVRIGPWGSTTGELDIAASTITFANHCGVVTLPGPATEDANGNFTITGPFPSNIADLHEQYSGHIAGSAMHLVVTDTSTNTALATYDLTFGVTGQVPIQTCP